MEENKNPNSLPKVGKKRKVKAVSKKDTELNPVSLPEQINIESLFLQAVELYKNDVLIQKKQTQKDFAHLSSMLEEYVSCFCLVGFSLKGEKITIFNASTHKDEGALVDLLRSTFFDIANNRP